jgi:cytochrome c-type biogenesis protein
MISFNLFSLSLLAGALAAFNPCGFVLLPAYLTSLILSGDSGERKSSMYLRATRFSLGMTIGFIGVFGGFALVVAPIAGSLEKFLPIITIVVGVALLSLAIPLIFGKTIFFKKIANPNIAPKKNWLSQVGYGVTFALVSLSCTVGPFLAITAAAIGTKNPFKIISIFITYALGMGIIVLTLSLFVATAETRIFAIIRRSQGLIGRLSGVFLLAVAAYEIWYGYYEIRILSGRAISDPIITFASGFQSRITQIVAGLGAPFLILLLVLLTALGTLRKYRARRAAIASTSWKEETNR